jgi:hypothetical protein
LKNKRINEDALEMIMRDVMQGMIGFTQEACCGSEMAKMEILAVEEAENYTQQSAAIIPFPRENKSKR